MVHICIFRSCMFICLLTTFVFIIIIIMVKPLLCNIFIYYFNDFVCLYVEIFIQFVQQTNLHIYTSKVKLGFLGAQNGNKMRFIFKSQSIKFLILFYSLTSCTLISFSCIGQFIYLREKQ